MQNTLSLVKDVRGCMTRFDPLTPEIVADQTEDGLTYDELKQVLEECGMDIEKVVFDGSRAFQNAFYADFEQGHYCWIPFQNHYPDYICNAHTHGMSKYGHQDFQLVLYLHPNQMGYVLNNLGLRVQAGERFKAGDLVEGIFDRCPLRLDEAEESGRKVLRVIIPDDQNRFPEDPDCTYPYSYQLVPTDELARKEGSVS